MAVLIMWVQVLSNSTKTVVRSSPKRATCTSAGTVLILDKRCIMPNKKKKPYTESGIRRQKCYRCGGKARTQWQICSDLNTWRPICLKCDYDLNELVLRWMGDEQCESKLEAYKEKLRDQYGVEVNKALGDALAEEKKVVNE